MSTIDNTLAERGSRYGEFAGHANITQRLKNEMVISQNWERLDFDMKEALEMVAHKIGRILNGDPQYIDSWTDIIGYTRLVEKRLLDAAAKPEDVPLGTTSDRNTDPFKAAPPDAAYPKFVPDNSNTVSISKLAAERKGAERVAQRAKADSVYHSLAEREAGDFVAKLRAAERDAAADEVAAANKAAAKKECACQACQLEAKEIDVSGLLAFILGANTAK